VYLSCFQE